MNWVKSRPFMGTFCTCSVGIVVFCMTVVVSSESASADTSTVVVEDPTFILTGRVYTDPAVTGTLSTVDGVKPPAVTEIL